MNSDVRAIHQIEITSRCNLRCKYCVHPIMPRPKVDMGESVFYRSLEVAATLQRQYPHPELNMAGIGESTLHPQFIPFMQAAHEAMPPYVHLVVTTNGLLVTTEMADSLASMASRTPERISVFVSLHRPEKAGPAVQILHERGLLAGVSADPSIAAVDWAGQVKWFVSAAKSPCPWIPGGWVMVAATGDVLTCCLDGSGIGSIGSIWNEPESMKVKPYSLCGKCNQYLPPLAA